MLRQLRITKPCGHRIAHQRCHGKPLLHQSEGGVCGPHTKIRGLEFDETEMVYLTRDQIGLFLADLDGRSIAAGVVACICLATGAFWPKAQDLTARHVRYCLNHNTRTKSSKNRAVPLTAR